MQSDPTPSSLPSRPTPTLPPLPPAAEQSRGEATAPILPATLVPRESAPENVANRSALIKKGSFLETLSFIPRHCTVLFGLGAFGTISGASAFFTQRLFSKTTGLNVFLLGTACSLLGLGFALRSESTRFKEKDLDRLAAKYSNPTTLNLLENTNAKAKAELINDVELVLEKYLASFPPELDEVTLKAGLTIRCTELLKNQKASSADKKRVLSTMLTDCQANIQTLQSRVKRDQKVIEERFFGGQKIHLEQIELKGEETHYKGQVPYCLHFKLEGTNEIRQVMYKARDIRVDESICGRHNGSLFNIFSRALKCPMPIYGFLQRADRSGQYGYVEFLTHTPADYTLNREEMFTFYRTMGRLQAISQIFGIFDLHAGNVITHQKLPHLIDLETAFNPILVDYDETTMLERAVTTPDERGKLTPNVVEYLQEGLGGQRMNMEAHYNQNFALYTAQMQEGYQEVVKSCRIRGPVQDELIRFIRSLPQDFQIRYPPFPTPILCRWLRIAPTRPNPAIDLSTLQPFSPRMGENIESLEEGANKILTKLARIYQTPHPTVAHLRQEIAQLSEDFEHFDVPAILHTLAGDFRHNHQLIFTLNMDMRERIIERIQNPPVIFKKFLDIVTRPI